MRVRSTLLLLAALAVAPLAAAQTAHTPYATGIAYPSVLVRLADGRVLVTEGFGGRVSVLAADGTRSYYATGLSFPYGLVQLADGRVLVAEKVGGRVSVLAADGTRSDYATGLDDPTGLVQLADGRVLVAEHAAGRVSVLAADGTRSDYATGLSGPYGLVRLVDGRVLVSEIGGGRVSVLAADGTRSDYATGFTEPRGLLQLADGRVLVGEATVTRVSVITGPTASAPATAPTAPAAAGMTHIGGGSYILEEGERTCSPNGVYCFIMATDGNVVLFKPNNNNEFVWGLHNHVGVPLGRGPQSLLLVNGMLMLGRGDGTVWSSNTSGDPGSKLFVTDGGRVEIRNGAGVVIWSVP